ncbi:hypothetical protein C1645_821194 [Glomus cerebriforme]|uniref:Uncharacterized protein n=1 Tax=Glomus cerebriforme TaxID=658196 RepID=A0A397T563_9GLOM|nr:hypothetical protein C1645_821194 [Glomus cerebriforme]
MRDIRKVTWLAHCDARIEWEKSINISQKSKKSSTRKKSREQATTRHHRHPSAYVPSTPTSPVFDPSLWLIWASSNFLHSGSWSNYRSSCLLINDINNRRNFLLSLNGQIEFHPLILDSFILLS